MIIIYSNKKFTGIPHPFHANIPRLNLLSSPEVRQPGKAPNYSVNWTTSACDLDCKEKEPVFKDNQPEIIDAMKGKEQVQTIMYRLLYTTEYILTNLTKKLLYPAFVGTLGIWLRLSPCKSIFVLPFYETFTKS